MTWFISLFAVAIIAAGIIFIANYFHKKGYCLHCNQKKDVLYKDEFGQPICRDCRERKILQNQPEIKCPFCSRVMQNKVNVEEEVYSECSGCGRILLSPEAAKDYLVIN